LAAQGGLQGGGHITFNKETTLRTSSRLAVAAIVAATVLGMAVYAYATTGATPNSNLHDGDIVQVHVDATTFPANTTIKVIECIHGATDGTQCEGLTNNQTKRSAADGSFDNPYTVRTLPDAAIPNPGITCDDLNPCDLYVGVDFNNFSQPKVLIPIAFAAATTTTTVASTTTTIGAIVPEASKAIALPLSAVALVGGGLVIAARRRRRTAGAVK
jgi:hypothetical protein